MGSFNSGIAKDGLTQGRISSTFNGAYEFSAFLLLILPIYLELFFETNRKKLKYFIISTIMLFCIYKTESRTSLIIAICIIGIIFFKTHRENIQKIVISILTVLLFGGIIILLNPFNNIDLSRFEQINVASVKNIFEITWENKNFEKYILFDNWYGDSTYTLNQIENLGMDASLYLRVSHWMQMIDGLIKYPILGLGISISGSAADGNYIRILSESGILGITLWCILLYQIYRSLKGRRMVNKIMKYSFITLIVGATLIDLFEASKVMMIFWFMLGATYSYEDIKEEEEKC